MKQSELQSLWQYAQRFPTHITARGGQYFKNNAVIALEIDNDFDQVTAVVTGSETYAVWLGYDYEDGWESDCECPYESNYCKHVYAVILAVLKHHQGGLKSKKSRHAKLTNPSVLIPKLEGALKRKPNKEELKMVRKITQTYIELARNKAQPTGYDLHEMGIMSKAPQWQTVDLWDKFPKNDHIFWLYLVHYCRREGISIPPWLEPVSDTQPIDERVRTHRRTKEINRWQHIFENEKYNVATPENSVLNQSLPSQPTRVELRLRFLDRKAVLEISLEEAAIWIQLTRADMTSLQEDLTSGKTVMHSECESLLNRMHVDYGIEPKCSLEYDQHCDKEALLGILLTSTLFEKCFNKKGKPFEFNPVPVKWAMRATDSEQPDDYELVLVDSDQQPVPPPSFSLDGQPSLLLFGNQWRVGPSSMHEYFMADTPCVVPKEAAECEPGLRFFTQSGVELPAPLQSRIQIVELRPVIRCRLDKSDNDECRLEVFAEAPDGKLIQVWDGEEWRKRGETSPDGVTIYDGSKLACIPRVMDPLKVRRISRWNYYGSQEGTALPFYQKRVTRAFPQQFFDWLEGLPKEVEVRLEGELSSFRKKSISSSVSLNAKENDIDWFDIQMVIDVEDTELSTEEIDLLLAAKGKWVRMDKKGWRRLLFQLSEDDSKDLARLGISPEQQSGDPQRFHALQLADPVAKKFLPARQAEAIVRRSKKIQTQVQPVIPKSIQATLRPYQVEGFHFLAYLSTNQFGGILADDMGLGKTVQTLAWIEWLRQEPSQATMPSLVVCPKSVMDNWHAEAERFVDGLNVRVWSAAELDEFHNSANDHHLHVINYNQLRLMGESLSSISFLTVVLDEGQNIKNPSSQTAQIARALNAQQKLILTGTPIENRLLDLWSLMAFAMPGILGSRNQFGKLYDAKDDPFARLRLSSRVRPFLIRRTKSQVAQDLPDRIEEDLLCEMEGTQKTLYKAEQKRAQQMLLKVKTKKELDKLRFHFLTSLLRLRQICCHPKLIQSSSRAKSAKLEALLEQLEPITEEGEKVLVFSQFVEMLSMLEKEVTKKNWKSWMLTGKTENRGELVKSFQEHKGGGVFLISLKAGGSGLNLTAASYVVLFDPWWNPAVENQAIDRTHRIGQKNNVVAYRFLIKNSIEEKIRKLQVTKKSMAEDVLGEEKFSSSLSLEDFEFLFS